MNNKSGVISNDRSTFFPFLSWLFGLMVCLIGIVNTFWGNDPEFGIFLVLLAFVYVPRVPLFIKEKTGFGIPAVAKILLGIFIIWAALGVGELFDKIDLMLKDIQ